MGEGGAQAVEVAEAGGMVSSRSLHGALCSGVATQDDREQLLVLCRLVELLREPLDVAEQPAKLGKVRRRAGVQALSGDRPQGEQGGRHRPLAIMHDLDSALHGASRP